MVLFRMSFVQWCLGTILLWASLTNAIVDLSEPWQLADNYNANELYCTLQKAMGRDVVGYLVIRDGAIVAEGYRTESDQTGLFTAYSSTKSWSTMVIGLLVDAEQLQVHSTLGEIFSDDSVWVDVIDADDKKTLTVKEILSMSSGLVEIGNIQDGFLKQNSLVEVLNATRFSSPERGHYNYLPTNHILAWIIQQVTGKSPLDVVFDFGAFSAMGLRENVDFTWEKYGGVEGSAFGLQINPRSLAKLGQLYLQEGYAAPNLKLISQEWVTQSTTNQLAPGVVPDNNAAASGYGYQWYTNEDGTYNALGGGGQIVWVYPTEGIVVSIMTTPEENPVSIITATSQSFQLANKARDNFDAIDRDVPDGCRCNLRSFLFGRLFSFLSDP